MAGAGVLGRPVAMPLDRPDTAVAVVQTTDSLDASQGGPPRTISALATGLSQLGARVRVVAFGEGVGVVTPGSECEVTFVPRGRGAAKGFRDATLRGDPMIVHDHGLWLASNRASAAAATGAGIPRVVSTRGMLEPWARNHHRWRKSAAWHAFQRRHLQRAAVLHATADAEADSLRAIGLTQPIAVIPNGVSLPTATATHSGAPRRALFLSRVHPKKGLPLLLDAWADVRPAGWELVIAGPDESGHRAELEAQVARLGLDAVRFVGSVPDDQKWALYRSAHLFVLPTYSENFGVVVAEALASGVPVLTTTGAPWEEIESHGSGWWVDPSARPVRDALADAVSRTDGERRAMGLRGRALVAARYDWGAIAAQMLEVYEWALGRRPLPPCTLRQ